MREGMGVARELYACEVLGVMRPGIRVRSMAYLNSFSLRWVFSRSQLGEVSYIPFRPSVPRALTYSRSQLMLTQWTRPFVATIFSRVLISPFMKTTCVTPMLLLVQSGMTSPPSCSITGENSLFESTP